jgi:hypothetical protein
MDPQWPLLTPKGAPRGVQLSPNARGQGAQRAPNKEVQGVPGPPMTISKGSDLAQHLFISENRILNGKLSKLSITSVEQSNDS